MERQESSPKAPLESPSSGFIYDALVRILGSERAEIVDFYIDSRLASVDSERYERAVLALLGERGGRMVINALRFEQAKRAAASVRVSSLM